MMLFYIFIIAIQRDLRSLAAFTSVYNYLQSLGREQHLFKQKTFQQQFLCSFNFCAAFDIYN